MKYFLFILLLVFSFSFVSSFSGGDGSLANPYQVANWTDLNNIRNYLTSNFSLINNLSSSDADYTGLGDNWLPIGNLSTNAFAGGFDGGNHTISDLKIYRNGTNYVGLFGYTKTPLSMIQNIGLKNVYVEGQSYVGGLVGYSALANAFLNCYVDGGVINGTSITGQYVGGLIGYKTQGTWDYNITKCWTNVTVINLYRYTGGLVGNFLGYIFNSYSIGNVSGNDRFVGGLVGSVSNPTNITNSYSKGYVYGGVAPYKGGLVGYKTTGAFNSINSYWDINTSGQTTSYLGTGYTTEQMKNISSFINWNILPTSINRNNGYPFLGYEVGNSTTWLMWDGTTPLTNCWSLVNSGKTIFIPLNCSYEVIL